VGWPLFFAICVVVAVPGLILLAWLQRREHFAALEASAVITREGG
jgi:PAT family beta-lactamase induction signal transducer AmpG